MEASNKFFVPPCVDCRRTLSFFIVSFTLSLLFVSCIKDDSKTLVVADFDAKYETYYRIVSFIEKMEGKQPTYEVLLPRSGYSPNDVIYYVEAAMNLQYTDPELTWQNLLHETDTFTISLTSGYASEQDVETLFERVRDTASVHFYSIEEPDRFPYMYDVVYISNTSSLLTISVTDITGTVHRDPLHLEVQIIGVFFHTLIMMANVIHILGLVAMHLTG